MVQLGSCKDLIVMSLNYQMEMSFPFFSRKNFTIYTSWNTTTTESLHFHWLTSRKPLRLADQTVHFPTHAADSCGSYFPEYSLLYWWRVVDEGSCIGGRLVDEGSCIGGRLVGNDGGDVGLRLCPRKQTYESSLGIPWC